VLKCFGEQGRWESSLIGENSRKEDEKRKEESVKKHGLKKRDQPRS